MLYRSLTIVCCTRQQKNGVFKLEKVKALEPHRIQCNVAIQPSAYGAHMQNRAAFACHHSIVAFLKDLAAKRGPDMP